MASPTVWCGSSVIGVSKTRCRCFTQDTTSRDDGERDVLRDHGDPAPPGDRLGHPAARDGGHVGDDERDRRTRAVAGGQVDVVARGHVGATRHHEDVVVGEVVARARSRSRNCTGPVCYRALQRASAWSACTFMFISLVITLRMVRSRSMTKVARFTGVMYFRFTPNERATSPDASESSG